MMPADRIVAASGRPERAPGWSGVADEGSGGKGMRLETRHTTPMPVKCGGSERCMEIMAVSFVECLTTTPSKPEKRCTQGY